AAAAVAERAIVALAGRDPGAEPMVEAVRQVRILLGDLGADVSRYLDQLEADPARLEAVTARRAALAGLTRKYGETIDEVLAWASRGAQRLAELDTSDDRIDPLTAERDQLLTSLTALAGRLTEARTAAADRLRTAVDTELAALALPRATLQFAVAPLPELGPYGID